VFHHRVWCFYALLNDERRDAARNTMDPNCTYGDDKLCKLGPYAGRDNGLQSVDIFVFCDLLWFNFIVGSVDMVPWLPYEQVHRKIDRGKISQINGNPRLAIVPTRTMTNVGPADSTSQPDQKSRALEASAIPSPDVTTSQIAGTKTQR